MSVTGLGEGTKAPAKTHAQQSVVTKLLMFVLWGMQAEERAEKEAVRQAEKDARSREREEAKQLARYPIEDRQVCLRAQACSTCT